jgi:DUF4097 and DUF4098 domain-containing protein YvlB
VDATSSSGDVTLTSVAGPRIGVSTTRGAIRYDGDPGQGSIFEFSTHAGDVDVALPPNASVDVTARSVNGAVQNDFPLQPKQHSMYANDGHSFTGTAASGSSVLRLTSFSGKIRVHNK